MTARRVAKVVIAIVTFRRNDDLGAVLPQVLAQVAGQRTGGPTGFDSTEFSVLVVDNDPDGGARQVVEALAEDRVRYVVEPTAGIAAARNRALREAADADVLIFIDDDERPQPGWLSGLLATYASTGADAVAGAVVSAFSGPLDAWISAGNFFNRRRLVTGTAIDVAATNNLLLDLHTVRRLGLSFDERFGQSGGSDTLFTRALVASGARMVWCDDAVVLDNVPVERMTRRWVVLRALRSGNSWSRTSIALAGSARDRLRVRVALTARGLPRLLGGLLRYGLGTLARSHSHQARGLRTLARGGGMLTGAYGYVYHEYRRNPR
ncbi:MAG: succinoglycan biosynthesis protein ExoM [Pseudonocardiales bacterium]|jgi:glycosyltransferase involved in cell wall biosynthesis|nr:succinoglycan biosynthesis protein ExoM [Pseudonocardiales bacterium]